MKDSYHKYLSEGRWFFWLVGVVLLGVSMYRAVHIPMTHDEACTYFYHTDRNNFTCFWDPGCWIAANNHLLNSIFIQGSIALFGVSDWSIRLPNLLSFGVYLWFSTLLSFYLGRSFVSKLAIFVCLNFNPFMFDFFSMARGYGMANGFLMGGLYYGYRTVQSYRLKWLLATFSFLFLSVLSNFVWVLTWVGAWGAISTVDGVHWLKSYQQGFRFPFRKHVVIAMLTMGLLAMIYVPIKTLSGHVEFQFGVDSLWNSLSSFVGSWLYGSKYFGADTVAIFTWIYVALFVISWVLSLITSRKREKIADGALFFGVLLTLVFVVQVVLFYTLGAKLLDTRKTLVYLPASVLFFGTALSFINMVGKKKILTGILWACILMIGIHFLRVTRCSYVREWWYDQHTFALLEELKEVAKDEVSPIKLGVKWIFWPSIHYYHQKDSLKYFEEVKFSTQLDTSGVYDWYYIQDVDYHLLEDQYDIYRDFGAGCLLVKRKE